MLTTTAQAGTAVAGVLVLAWMLRSRLPEALESAPRLPVDLEYFSAHPALIASDALTAGCWCVAAVLFGRASQRTGDRLTGWLAIAGVLAAVSSLNYALLPTHLIELMYLGDYFFLVAVALLLFAAVREVGAAEAARVDQALYTERRRIAQEMHDGVTQELAFIASQAHSAEPTRPVRIACSAGSVTPSNAPSTCPGPRSSSSPDPSTRRWRGRSP